MLAGSDPQPSCPRAVGELNDDEAFELLGLTSLLMRKLDQVRTT